MFNSVRRTLLISLFIGLPMIVFSQNKGDEARKMYNDASSLDQKEIDEAVNGWWTESMKTHDERIEWWQSARFGMFIHWGVSSVAGGDWKGKKINGYAEHLMRIMKITKAEYVELAKQFNPIEFNAEEWVKTAKATGMKYFIVTAKHHDGLAMYDSDYSDFDLTLTPFKRDPMAELAAACRKYDLKFGFYYSHAFDWEDPNAPGNDWEFNNPGGDRNLFGGREWYVHHSELIPKAVQYVNEKAIPQIKELIRKYNPDILWFDTPHKLPFSENLRILKEIRKVAPNIVINGRLAQLGRDKNFGDYQNTADRPAEFYPVKGLWEAIPTTNESYGYNKNDNRYKTPAFFVQLLAKSASRGGNLLLNVGPMANGAFDSKDVAILKQIGYWMDVNNESIYGSSQTTLALQNWGVTTQKKNKLYLHVFEWPKDGNLLLGGVKSNVGKAYFLADKKKAELKLKRINDLDISIQLKKKQIDTLNTVIVLEMLDSIKTDSVRLLDPTSNNKLLAFDADLHGKGFVFGDGKPNNFYVENWISKEQWVSWSVRLNKVTDYTLTLNISGSTNSAGRFKLLVGNNSFSIEIPEKQKSNQTVTIEVGKVHLIAGMQEIKILPEEITGKELMKLLEIDLKPN